MLHLAIYIETLEYILVPVIPVANRFYTWICGVVVITSALHAEGPQFDPGQILLLIYFKVHFYNSYYQVLMYSVHGSVV